MYKMCLVSPPDELRYHWHGRNELEECVELSARPYELGELVMLAFDSESPAYAQLKHMGYIQQETDMTAEQHAAHQVRVRDMVDALSRVPS